MVDDRCRESPTMHRAVLEVRVGSRVRPERLSLEIKELNLEMVGSCINGEPHDPALRVSPSSRGGGGGMTFLLRTGLALSSQL